MRFSPLIAALILFSGLLSADIAIHTASARSAHSAAVVTDEETGVVRIVIDGRDILRADADGVEINGVLKPTRIVHPTLSGPLPSGNGGSE